MWCAVKEARWEFVALVPLFDPPRHDTADTVANCLHKVPALSAPAALAQQPQHGRLIISCACCAVLQLSVAGLTQQTRWSTACTRCLTSQEATGSLAQPQLDCPQCMLRCAAHWPGDEGPKAQQPAAWCAVLQRVTAAAQQRLGPAGMLERRGC